MKRDSFSTLCAALAYAFCAFALFAAVRHPFFANPLIYLPLLLLGVEKILRDEKPWFFIAIVFVALASSFYFFYMLSILTAIYVLIRLVYLHKRNLRHMLRDSLKIVGFALTGAAMACVIFIPNLLALLSTYRMGIGATFDLFHRDVFYERFLGDFIGSNSPGSWTRLGITAIAFMGLLFLLFSTGRKYLELKTGFVLLTAFLMFPFFGR